MTGAGAPRAELDRAFHIGHSVCHFVAHGVTDRGVGCTGCTGLFFTFHPGLPLSPFRMLAALLSASLQHDALLSAAGKQQSPRRTAQLERQLGLCDEWELLDPQRSDSLAGMKDPGSQCALMDPQIHIRTESTQKLLR
jgi:hypothetical protein